MNALQRNKTNRGPVIWLAFGLALLATLSYLLIRLGALGVWATCNQPRGRQ